MKARSWRAPVAAPARRRARRARGRGSGPARPPARPPRRRPPAAPSSSPRRPWRRTAAGATPGTASVTRPAPARAGGPADEERRAGVVERAGQDEQLAERALVAARRPLRQRARRRPRRRGSATPGTSAARRRRPDSAGRPGSAARPKPTGTLRHRAAPRSAELAQPLDPGEDPPLAIVQPLLDVGREDESAPPAVRTPNAIATAYSASWLIETAIRPMPSCSARAAARPWRRTAGWPVGSRSISMSRQPMPRTPRPRTFDTASLAAHRPAIVSGRSRT